MLNNLVEVRNNDYVSIGLNDYLDMSEDDKAIAFFNERKRSKALQGKLINAEDGVNKYWSTAEVVKRLNIDKLTTTILNKWFCSIGYGEMRRFKNQKNRYFHPNENFETNIAKLGYATTGKSLNNNKPKISYKPNIIEVLNKEETRKSIEEFIHNEL